MNIINKIRNLLQDLNDTILSKNTKIEYINNSIGEYSRNIENFGFTTLQFDNIQNCFILPNDFLDYIVIKSDEFCGELREYTDFMINKKDGKIFIINGYKYNSLYIQYNKKFNKLFEGNLDGEYIIGDTDLILNTILDLEIGDKIIIGDGSEEEECEILEIDGNEIVLKNGLIKEKSLNSRVIGDLKINEGDEELIILYFNYLYKSFNNIIQDGNEENWSQGQVSQTIKYNSSISGQSYLKNFNDKIKTNQFYKFKELGNGDEIGFIKINMI